MSSSHHDWLHQQLPRWQTDGILSAPAAERIKELYPLEKPGVGLGQILLGVLGALLVGSGVITLLAHNWDSLGRAVRLGLAFAPLLLSQLLSLWVMRRGETAQLWWRELAGLLQTLAVGACIAIVSQVYHLGGTWTEFLLVWTLLSLPLLPLLRSHAVAAVSSVALATWAVGRNSFQGVWYETAMAYPVLLLLLLACWYLAHGWKAPPVMLRWIAVPSIAAGLGAAADVACSVHKNYWQHEHHFVLVLQLVAVAMLLFPLTRRGREETTWKKPHQILGTLWCIGFAFICSYAEAADHLAKGLRTLITEPFSLVVGLPALAFTWLAFKHQRWALLAIAASTLLPITALGGEIFFGLAGNLYLLALGVALIVLDSKGQLSAPRLGALLIASLVLTRMADSDLGLIAKGISFIVVGLAFIGFNLHLGRRNKSSQALS
jgi:uncharacterized membrane protein